MAWSWVRCRVCNLEVQSSDLRLDPVTKAVCCDACRKRTSELLADRNELLAICREQLELWDDAVGADDDVPSIVLRLREVLNARR